MRTPKSHQSHRPFAPSNVESAIDKKTDISFPLDDSSDVDITLD